MTIEADLLKDRILLITGSSQGIGRQVALSCAEHGATVVCLGRNEKLLESLYDEIVDNGWPTPAIIPCDLLKLTPEQANTLQSQLADAFPRLDGLLHNAASLGVLSPITHYKPDEWLKVMQVNVNAPFLLTKALLPLLKKSPDASLLFTSADVGQTGKAYWGAYGVSKFAIEGLMQILAQELEDNTTIRVNCINPGRAQTKLRATAYPAEKASDNPHPKEFIKYYLKHLGPSRGNTKPPNGQHIRVCLNEATQL